MSEATDNTTIEVSFIDNDQRYQAQFEVSPAQREMLNDMTRSVDADSLPKAFGIMDVPTSEEDSHGSAQHLVETITNEIVFEDSEEEDIAAWNQVKLLAEQIDKNATGPGCKTILVEFIWDNGGSDDNLFSQNFVANVGGDDNEALLSNFLEKLEAAGVNNFYDFDIRTEFGADGYMNLTDLIETLMDLTDDDEEDLLTKTLMAMDKAGEEAPEAPAIETRKRPKP